MRLEAIYYAIQYILNMTLLGIDDIAIDIKPNLKYVIEEYSAFTL